MKTINQIKVEISETADKIKSGELKKAEENRLRKHISFLRQCIHYIETEPDENFIESQIKMVENKIGLRMKGFDIDPEKIDRRTYSKMKRAHEKEFEVPKLRNQVKAMRFLLK